MKHRNFWGMSLTIFVFILIGIGSWSLYSLLTEAIQDGLLHWNITNPYTQNLIIIGGIVLILAVLGTGFYKALVKIIGR